MSTGKTSNKTIESLRKPILATIGYYNTFDYALTLMEVYKFMINPARFSKIENGIGIIDLGKVHTELEDLVKLGLISRKNGFYFMNNLGDLYELRISRQKIAAMKWKKFLKFSQWLVAVPYLRTIFASGSMAIENTVNESDFDVLVVSKHGRIYTCRFFLWLATSLMRSRRRRDDRVAPDKFCFNHYITDESLHIIHESLFNAQTYVNLIPVINISGTAQRFFGANVWLNNYVYNFKPQYEFVRRTVEPNPALRFIAVAGEVILNTFIGDWIEDKLKKYQEERIKSNPVTHESGGRVVYGDRELEFHPHSIEGEILKKYKMNLRKLGIVPYVEEKDSGLL